MINMVARTDILTADEAAVYLRLDSKRSLETVRKNYGLIARPGFGKSLRYYRADLDDVLLRMVGRSPERKPLSKDGAQKMRLAK